MASPALDFSPGRVNLVVPAGNTCTWTATWKDDNGNLVNLTGYTATIEIKRSASGALIHTSSSSGGSPEIVLGGTLGTITVTWSATVTAALINGVWDLKMVDGSGNVTYLLTGIITLQPVIST